MQFKVTTYQKCPTSAELQACCEWFEQHLAELPPRLETKGLSIPDLPQTVSKMLHHLRHQCKEGDSKGTFSGNFALLTTVRQLIGEQPSSSSAK